MNTNHQTRINGESENIDNEFALTRELINTLGVLAAGHIQRLIESAHSLRITKTQISRMKRIVMESYDEDTTKAQILINDLNSNIAEMNGVLAETRDAIPHVISDVDLIKE